MEKAKMKAALVTHIETLIEAIDKSQTPKEINNLYHAAREAMIIGEFVFCLFDKEDVKALTENIESTCRITHLRTARAVHI